MNSNTTTNNPRNKRSQREARGIVQAGLDIAIGGTALAFDKAAEIAEDVRDRVEDFTEGAKKKTERAVRQVEANAKRVEKRVENAVDDAATTARKEFGTPDTRTYEARTAEELYNLASERDISGRSTMTKDELIAALRS